MARGSSVQNFLYDDLCLFIHIKYFPYLLLFLLTFLAFSSSSTSMSLPAVTMGSKISYIAIHFISIHSYLVISISPSIPPDFPSSPSPPPLPLVPPSSHNGKAVYNKFPCITIHFVHSYQIISISAPLPGLPSSLSSPPALPR